MKKPIFCNECKHFLDASFIIRARTYGPGCKHPNNLVPTYRNITHGNPKEINAKNNCKSFEPIEVKK